MADDIRETPNPNDDLRLETPCCKRAFRFTRYNTATEVYQRQCPGCKQEWQIIVRPQPDRIPGVQIHVADWTRR